MYVCISIDCNIYYKNSYMNRYKYNYYKSININMKDKVSIIVFQINQKWLSDITIGYVLGKTC